MDQHESGNVVIAIYRPKLGRDRELRQLISRHVPYLRSQGLATERPVVLLRSTEDGSYLEIFEWASPEAVSAAHTHPGVMKLWDEFGALSDMLALGQLPGASRPFSHFEVVDAVAP